MITTEITCSCPQHGEYSAETHTIHGLERGWTSGCPTCEQERKERRRIRDEEMARQDRLDRIARNRKNAKIPARFASSTFENYMAVTAEQQRALATAREFAEKISLARQATSSLTLCGNPGTGKTHLACAVGNHLLDAGPTVIYTQTIELVRAVRDTWRRGSDQSEIAVIDTYRTVGLLILDEVGVQFGSEAEKTQLFDVLDGRYRDLRPTLIVSNLNGNGLQERLGVRIFDRLMEVGSKLVIFDWKSHRREAAPAIPNPSPCEAESLSERLDELRSRQADIEARVETRMVKASEQ